MRSARKTEGTAATLTIAALLIGAAVGDSSSESCDCYDLQPPGGIPCEQQRRFRKCDRDWMKAGGYCRATCGLCKSCGSSPIEQIRSGYACPTCSDIPPPGDFTCEEQVKFGKCDEEWMEGLCEKTCGKCKCPEGDMDVQEVPLAVSSEQSMASTEEPSVIPNPPGTAADTDEDFSIQDGAVIPVPPRTTADTDTDADVSTQEDVVTPIPPVSLSGVDLDNSTQERVMASRPPRSAADADGDDSTQERAVITRPTRSPADVDVDDSTQERVVIPKSPVPAADTKVDADVDVSTQERELDRVIPGAQGSNGDDLLPLSTAFSSESKAADCSDTIGSVMTQSGELSNMIEALRAANLDVLDNTDLEVTVFAPVDLAFEDLIGKLKISSTDVLYQDQSTLEKIMNYHVVPGIVTADDLSKSSTFETLSENKTLTVPKKGQIEGVGSSARIISEAIPVCRSYIYLINKVLLPTSIPELQKNTTSLPSEDQEQSKSGKCDPEVDILSSLQMDPDLSTLVQALQVSGLSGMLETNRTEFTVFAPTNEGFSAAVDSLGISLRDLFINRDQLAKILRYHIIDGNIEEKDIEEGKTKTLNKDSDLVIIIGDQIEVEGISGSGYVIEADSDISCNAAVHKIDSLLLPFEAPAAVVATSEDSAPTGATSSGQKCRTLAEVIAQDDSLTILNEAVQVAGLQPVLSDRTQRVTLFAPTDAAFSALLSTASGQIPEMLEDPDSLLSIISYHAVSKPFISQSLIDGKILDTLIADKDTGKPLQLTVQENPSSPLGIDVNGLTGSGSIIQKDIVACASVVHIIDGVLLPIKAGSDIIEAGNR